MTTPDLGTIAGIAAVVMVAVGIMKTQFDVHGKVTAGIAGLLALMLSLGHALTLEDAPTAASTYLAVVRGVLAWGTALGVSWVVREPPKTGN